MTFAEKILQFNSHLSFDATLPGDIQVMNPFTSVEVVRVCQLFYRKFFNDHFKRKLILGINPGRYGSGVTGIPFTDTKRLRNRCGIKMDFMLTHETSSVFIYEMIDAYGGVREFYKNFYINAVCPLGFIRLSKNGKFINYNYYDNKDLQNASLPFIIKTIKMQLDFGIDTSICFCLGTGKNFRFLQSLNGREHFFEKIIPLEHPRFIMQYKLKNKNIYIDKYLEAFKNI